MTKKSPNIPCSPKDSTMTGKEKVSAALTSYMHSTESRTDQEGRRVDDSPGRVGGEPKIGLHRLQRAVDDTGVVSEQQTSECRHNGDEVESSLVGARSMRWQGDASRCRGHVTLMP